MVRPGAETEAVGAGRTTSPIYLEAYEEPIRTFLLGQSPFPADITVVTVCTDALSREIFSTPSETQGNPQKSYGLVTRGVEFRVVMGTDVPLASDTTDMLFIPYEVDFCEKLRR
jgi:hypothetical protein